MRRQIISFFGRYVTLLGWLYDPGEELSRLEQYRSGDSFAFARGGRQLVELLTNRKFLLPPGELIVLIRHDRLPGISSCRVACPFPDEGWTVGELLTAIADVAVEACRYQELERFVVIGIVLEGRTVAPLLFDRMRCMDRDGRAKAPEPAQAH